ncbi:MAG: Ppx/GppA family phosphatase [Bacteroidetes bacterium]|nr:Ppx/GppA family phosphatase [Bacteroidota bacterium]MCX7907848.1 Ppx/GppA family phosphatase [Bacteroidota bacterium]
MAAIDIGTNTVLLLVAEVASGIVRPLYQEQRFGRLGQGVDASGRLQPEAVERVVAIVRRYLEVARTWGVERIGAVATSAVREARNRELLLGPLGEFGLGVRVLSGQEEAYWTYMGVRSGFPEFEELAVLDIGGGSAEFTWGRGLEVRFRISLPLGCVRLTERYLSAYPVDRAHLRALEQAVEAAWGAVSLPGPLPVLVGVAGTVTSLAALELGLSEYAPERVERFWIARERVLAWIERLCSLDGPDEILALGPRILAGRADVWLAGLVILAGLLRRLDAPGLYASDRGLRYGWALYLAGNLSGEAAVGGSGLDRESRAR